MKKLVLILVSVICFGSSNQAFSQTSYFDFGPLVTYLDSSQCYGVGNAILPFSKKNGDILCFYLNAYNYPMQYYNYTTINSDLQSNTSPFPVFNNDRNGYPVGYMNKNFTYIVSVYQTSGKDKLLFSHYNNNEDAVEFIGEKSWFPTSAFSDNGLIGLIEAPNNKLYLLNGWKYAGWSNTKEDLYISYSADSMNTWNNWIGGGHINGEGDIISSSVVCDLNSNLYICMNTTWGGNNIVLYTFDPVTESFPHKITIDEGYGGTIYLNPNTGKLTICYTKEDKPTVRYSHITDPSIWSSPIIIDNSLTNAIHGIGNTIIGGLFNNQKIFYLWTSEEEQFLFEWDGDSTWIKKGLIQKSLDEKYYPSNKVLSDQNGNAIIFQSYINNNSELFVHVKRLYDTNAIVYDILAPTDIIRIYPNPFSDKTTIEFNNPNQLNYKLSVFSITGNKVVEIENIRTNKIEIEKGNLSKGIYIIELKGENIL